MPAEDRLETNDDLTHLLRRIDALEAAVVALEQEVVTRRIEVVDPDGRSTLVAEVVDSALELRVGLSGEAGRRTEVLCFAIPARQELPRGVGIQLWANGDIADELCWWGDDD